MKTEAMKSGQAQLMVILQIAFVIIILSMLVPILTNINCQNEKNDLATCKNQLSQKDGQIDDFKNKLNTCLDEKSKCENKISELNKTLEECQKNNTSCQDNLTLCQENLSICSNTDLNIKVSVYRTASLAVGIFAVISLGLTISGCIDSIWKAETIFSIIFQLIVLIISIIGFLGF